MRSQVCFYCSYTINVHFTSICVCMYLCMCVLMCTTCFVLSWVELRKKADSMSTPNVLALLVKVQDSTKQQSHFYTHNRLTCDRLYVLYLQTYLCIYVHIDADTQIRACRFSLNSLRAETMRRDSMTLAASWWKHSTTTATTRAATAIIMSLNKRRLLLSEWSTDKNIAPKYLHTYIIHIK